MTPSSTLVVPTLTPCTEEAEQLRCRSPACLALTRDLRDELVELRRQISERVRSIEATAAALAWDEVRRMAVERDKAVKRAKQLQQELTRAMNKRNSDLRRARQLAEERAEADERETALKERIAVLLGNLKALTREKNAAAKASAKATTSLTKAMEEAESAAEEAEQARAEADESRAELIRETAARTEAAAQERLALHECMLLERKVARLKEKEAQSTIKAAPGGARTFEEWRALSTVAERTAASRVRKWLVGVISGQGVRSVDIAFALQELKLTSEIFDTKPMQAEYIARSRALMQRYETECLGNEFGLFLH